MDISFYFEPIDTSLITINEDFTTNNITEYTRFYFEGSYFPDLTGVDIAIIGVKEDRKAVNNKGCDIAADLIRKFFYKLYSPSANVKIADLGNIMKGHSIEDTYFAVSSVVSELIRRNIMPVIIGGSQDITFGNYLAYESLGQIINIVSIDAAFDIGKSEDDFNSKSFISKIILHQPNFLFNYTTIGYQSYFVDPDAIELMKNLYFDVYRLGHIRNDITEVEPIVRNADVLSFDLSSIRQSDAPGNGNASPHGFYGHEACQIARYAGMSDKLSSVGFYEMNPAYDHNGQTSHLTAQMIWYFIEGFYNRKSDYPYKEKENFKKFTVDLKNQEQNIIFYKSKKSDRWWMEVPYPTNVNLKYARHYLVPCSYSDYLAACENDIPDRWWQVYQKLM